LEGDTKRPKNEAKEKRTKNNIIPMHLKRTLYFGTPAYLKKQRNQLVIERPEQANALVPIEDIGVVVLDCYQITLTSGLLQAFVEKNVAVIQCDEAHLPVGLLLPLHGNVVQTERYHAQITASEPLRKHLWGQVITQKIANQGIALGRAGGNSTPLLKWSREVKAGDSTFQEGRSAAYYWQHFFELHLPEFYRGRGLAAPNNLLNYGYAIVRSVMARAIVSSGLLPTLGIHHHNRYNAYCLADDMMEPYRVWVDLAVLEIVATESLPQPLPRRGDGREIDTLTMAHKTRLLKVMQEDVMINDSFSPLLVAVGHTAHSLVRCFEGEQRKLALPMLMLP
jgi:CRISP-associated protein Cas1